MALHKPELLRAPRQVLNDRVDFFRLGRRDGFDTRTTPWLLSDDLYLSAKRRERFLEPHRMLM